MDNLDWKKDSSHIQDNRHRSKNKLKEEKSPLDNKIEKVQKNLELLKSTEDPEQKEILLDKMSEDSKIFREVLKENNSSIYEDWNSSENSESLEFEETINNYTKEIISEKNEIKQIELVGQMTEHLIEGKSGSDIKSLEKQINIIEKAIENTSINLKHIKILSPYTKSLVVLLPILRNRYLEKMVEQYEKLVQQLKEASQNDSKNLNLKYKEAKSELKLLKIQKIKSPAFSNHKKIALKYENSLEMALEFLIPILPQGYETLKRLSAVPKEIKSVLQIAQSKKKIKERSQSLQLLRSMKDILNTQMEELKLNPSSNTELDEQRIREEQHKIEVLERQVLFEGTKRLKNVLQLLEGLFLGSQFFSSASKIVAITNILGTLKTIPGFATGAIKVAEGWKKIEKLQKLIESLKDKIQKTHSENSLFKYLNWKKEALEKGALIEEGFDLVCNACGMVPLTGKLAKGGAILMGASQALLGTLGIPALLSLVTYFGVQGTKFLIFHKGFIPKATEDINIYFDEKTYSHEVKEFQKTTPLFMKEIFIDFDNFLDLDNNKNKEIPPTNLTKLINKFETHFENLNFELGNLKADYLEFIEKIQENPKDKKTSLKLNEITQLQIDIQTKMSCILEIQNFLFLHNNQLILIEEIQDLKISVIERLFEKNLHLQQKKKSIDLRKEENLKKYEMRLNLDRIGISKEEYQERILWLAEALKDPSTCKEFFEYIKESNPILRDQMLEIIDKEGDDEEGLRKITELLMEDILKKPGL